MTKLCLILIVALVAAAIFASSSAAPECIKLNRACVRSSECCGGCCNEGKCTEYAESCTMEKNPCHLFDCPPGKECYLHQVQCVAAPCNPVPACRDTDYSDYDD